MDRRSAFSILLSPVITARAADRPLNGLRTIGFLGNLKSSTIYSAELKRSLSTLGWTEGRNLRFEYRAGDDDLADQSRLARELSDLGAEVLVVNGAPSTIRAALAANSNLPVVMAVGLDPVRSGFVQSLNRPGGRVTGLAWDQSPEISGKYLELLREMVPTARTVGCLIDPRAAGIGRYREVVERAADRLMMTPVHVEVTATDQIGPAFDRFLQVDAQAVMIYGSGFLFTQLRSTVDLAAKARLPDIYIFKEAVALGGLMSYGVSLLDLYRRAASYVDRILRGANPAELPIELPTRYELTFNSTTARRLGLRPPQSLLARVDEVVGN